MITTDLRPRCPSVYPKGMLKAPLDFQIATGVWGYVACCVLPEGHEGDHKHGSYSWPKQ